MIQWSQDKKRKLRREQLNKCLILYNKQILLAQNKGESGNKNLFK